MKLELESLVIELETDKLIGKGYILKRLKTILESEKHRYRGVSGSKNYSAVLTEKEVKQIKKMFQENKTHVEIADHFGVGRSTIGRIVRGQSWRNVN